MRLSSPLSAALATKRTMSQVVLTVVRVGDGKAIDGLSFSVRQIVQIVLALTSGTGTGPSKRPFVYPTLSFLVSF